MKELKRKSILILGLVIATLALINNFSYADTNINREKHVSNLQIEQLALEILNTNVEENKIDAVYKVFNDTNQLVYETRNNKDEKLIQLIKTSDFLAEVNKISYYKLSR